MKGAEGEEKKKKDLCVSQRSIVDRRSASYINNGSFWYRFKAFVCPWLRQSEDLVEAYAKAKVEREENEARKIAEEAAEIAARKDVTRQKEVKTFNAIIDDIFKDDTLPMGAKALKLAKLIENNPQVAKQLENVTDIIEKLALKKGLNIEVVDDSQKFLSEEESAE